MKNILVNVLIGIVLFVLVLGGMLYMKGAFTPENISKILGAETAAAPEGAMEGESGAEGYSEDEGSSYAMEGEAQEGPLSEMQAQWKKVKELEEKLRIREEAMAIQQKRLEEGWKDLGIKQEEVRRQLEELKKERAASELRIASEDSEAESNIKSVAKQMESMEAESAARMLMKMDKEKASKILENMTARKAGPIYDAMTSMTDTNGTEAAAMIADEISKVKLSDKAVDKALNTLLTMEDKEVSSFLQKLDAQQASKLIVALEEVKKEKERQQ